jgi:hypothetical protein
MPADRDDAACTGPPHPKCGIVSFQIERLGCLLLRTVRDCRILAALRPRQQRERDAAYR